MLKSISSAQPQANVGATNIGFSKTLKAGHFVVNPVNIQPYSFYDDLKKGENFYKDALKSLGNDAKLKSTQKKSNFMKNLLGCVALVFLSVLAYKKWDVIVNFIKNIKK